MNGDGPFSERQQELLEQAFVLVREGGLAALTVRRLADRMGFSEAALYRHFPSKSVLLCSLVEHLTEGRLLPPMRLIASRSELPPAERMVLLLSHHLRMVISIDGLPVLLLAEAAATGDPDLLKQIRRVASTELEILAQLAAELPPDPRRPQPRYLAHMLLGLPAATAMRLRILPDDALDSETCIELARDLVTQLVAPRNEETR